MAARTHDNWNAALLATKPRLLSIQTVYGSYEVRLREIIHISFYPKDLYSLDHVFVSSS